MTNYTYGNLDPRYVQAIRGFEGFKPKAAWDVRQNSNGYGTRALYPGEVIDRAEAERRLHNELTHAAGIVDGYAANLDPSTRAALVSLTYNSGGDWMKSGLGQAVKAGDWDAARRSFGQYTKSDGVHLPGLASRRNAELGWFGTSNELRPVQATYPFPAPMALGAPREPVQAPSEVLAQNYGSSGTPQPSSAPQWDTGAFWAGKAAESKADGGSVPTADEILAEYSDPVGQFHHKLLEQAPIVPPWDRPGTKSPVTGTLSNPPDRPSDWAVKSGVAETVSPTMGAYGVGSILGEVAGATKAGNLGEAGMNALPLGAMFIGPGAKTANKTNMLRAQEMHAKGLPREAIWKDTGWFQGADGKWRYEIDDSKARLTDWDRHKHGASNVAWDATAREKSGVTKTPTGMNTVDFIEHPELAKTADALRNGVPYDGADGASVLAAIGGDRDAGSASKALREAGIPGIRYLDQGSRSLGDGSRNYVVFDPTMIEIMRKYGLIPPLAVGAGAAVTAPATDAQPLNYANGGAVHRALKVAEKSVNRTPSDAQKEAGNYAKGHLTYKGLNVTIENPKGSERSGMGRNGKRWSVKMPAAYGYVKSTEGYDGDHVDVYLGPDHDSDKVFVVDQINAETGKFDEHKCMLSYPSKDDALADYRKAFSDGKASDRIGAVTEMTMDRFKSWVKSPGTKVPLGDIRKGYADGGPVPTADEPDEILAEYTVDRRMFG